MNHRFVDDGRPLCGRCGRPREDRVHARADGEAVDAVAFASAAMLLASPLTAAGQLLDAYDAEAMAPMPLRKGDDFYGYVSMPLERWAFSMEVARDHLIAQRGGWYGDVTYLEVGCGIGTKMRLAQLMGWRAHGIEIWQPFVDYANDSGQDVEQADATRYDRYANYSLVYAYRPCVELQAERDFIAYLVEQMAPGALLFHAGAPDPLECEHVGGEVWQIPTKEDR